MAQAMKPKDQKLTKPVLQGDPEDEPPVSRRTFSACPHLSQLVPPFPDSLPPSVSPLQSCQQPLSPSDVPHLSQAWSPSPQPLSHHLRSYQAPAPQAKTLRMLFQEMQGPQQIGADSMVQPRCSILYYQSFSTTDLLNWRNHTPPYSENPQAMVDLESITSDPSTHLG
jgi:hypothetical protein